MTYTLTINNVGTANTSDVRVVDTLPPGVTLAGTPFETTSLFSCDSDAPANPITVTCDGGAVNQGQNATIKINAISPAAAPPNQITNTAVVDPDNDIEESNELNNTSATVNTNLSGPPPAPLLSIKKTDGEPNLTGAWNDGAGPDPVNPGEELVYKIQVVNNATSRADDVRVSDTTQFLEASSIIASQVIVNGAIGVGGGLRRQRPRGRLLHPVAQRRRNDDHHDPRHRHRPGRIEHLQHGYGPRQYQERRCDQHGNRVDDHPPVDRPQHRQDRQPGSRLRPDVAHDESEPAPAEPARWPRRRERRHPRRRAPRAPRSALAD